MLQQIQETCHWPPPGRTWLDSSLFDVYDVEYSLQICYVIAFVVAFHYNIIYVALYGLTYVLVENYINHMLVCYPRVLQSERHHGVRSTLLMVF